MTTKTQPTQPDEFTGLWCCGHCGLLRGKPARHHGEPMVQVKNEHDARTLQRRVQRTEKN